MNTTCLHLCIHKANKPKHAQHIQTQTHTMYKPITSTTYKYLQQYIHMNKACPNTYIIHVIQTCINPLLFYLSKGCVPCICATLIKRVKILK